MKMEESSTEGKKVKEENTRRSPSAHRCQVFDSQGLPQGRSTAGVSHSRDCILIVVGPKWSPAELAWRAIRGGRQLCQSRGITRWSNIMNNLTAKKPVTGMRTNSCTLICRRVWR